MSILEYAQAHVPYYKDVFAQKKIDLDKIRKDIKFFQDIPFLTKDIILEQEERMLSTSLKNEKQLACKTGGSTGSSVTILYDEEAANRSAAITRYCRLKVGRKYHRSELHFACDFSEPQQHKFWQRETLKCAAMNRTNIFFSEINDEGLQNILSSLNDRRPYLVHGHPSTLYHVAHFAKTNGIKAKLFKIFEPSGEYCSHKMKVIIEDVFGCKTHNRYGLAEFGVVAYQLDNQNHRLRVLESDYWVDASETKQSELIITGFYNRLMPMIRYKSGDEGLVKTYQDGKHIEKLSGRIHDKINLNGTVYLTHHIQDILDHRVGGIKNWQIVQKQNAKKLLIFENDFPDRDRIKDSVSFYFGSELQVNFVKPEDFVLVGRHSKFRYLIKQ